MCKRMGALVFKFSCVGFTVSGLENGQKTVLTFFSIFLKNSLMSRMPTRLPRIPAYSVVSRGCLLLSVVTCNGEGLGIERVKVKFLTQE